MTRVLIIGEAPSASRHDRLHGRSGRTLARMAGFEFPAFLAATDRINVLAEHPGRGRGGDCWPRPLARFRGALLRPELRQRRSIILGSRVADALGLSTAAALLRWSPLPEAPGEWALLPHPSGANRWYNDADNRWAAARFLRDALGGPPLIDGAIGCAP